MQQGKAACYLDGMGNTQHIFDSKKTTLGDRMAFAGTPSGPKGHFPQLAVHGYFINKASKNKAAAWEFLKWAVSNPAFTVQFGGWTDEESRLLLLYLYQHAARPEFSCRFQWRPGSIAFWDNRCTWHYALNDYSGERRLMQRITIEGVPLG